MIVGILWLLFACAGGERGPEAAPEALPTPAPATVAEPEAPVAPETPGKPVSAEPTEPVIPADAPVPGQVVLLPEGLIVCPQEYRSGMCTREHRPACGYKNDGSHSTGPNKCVACSDASVVGYIDGECPK